MSRIESPCIDVCEIDPATKLCRGCHRTMDEIVMWGRLSPDERRVIMLRLPERKNAQNEKERDS